MKINWRIRLKSPKFYATVVIPIVVIIASNIWNNLDATQLTDELNNVLSAVFAIVATIGGVVDPTTKGLNDSEQAMNYTATKKQPVKKSD